VSPPTLITPETGQVTFSEPKVNITGPYPLKTVKIPTPAKVTEDVKKVEKNIQTEISMGKMINMSEIENLIKEYPQYKSQILTSVIGLLVKSRCNKSDIEKLEQLYNISPFINKKFDILSKKSTFERNKIRLTKPTKLADYENFTFPNTITVKF